MAIFTQGKLSLLLGSQHHFHTPHVPIPRGTRRPPRSAAFKIRSRSDPCLMQSDQSDDGQTNSTDPSLGLFVESSFQSTWSHRAWVVVGCTAVLTTLTRSVEGAASSSHWVEPALAGLAGYLAADLSSGVYHWAIDNYGDASTPVFGPQIEAFQGHHERPRTIASRQFANNTYALARAVSLAVLLCGGGGPGPASSAFVGVWAGCILLSQQFHAWAHATRTELQRGVEVLQELGVLVSRRQHAAHHRAPHDNNYCIVSGVWNGFLDEGMVFRALEMALFFKLGVRPRSWGEPPNKDQ